MWKTYEDAERLIEEFQKYPWFYEKRKKGYKERKTGRKILGEQLSSF